MTKANLGEKRICAKCSARFYDLGKNPAACPKCGAMNDITAPVKARRSKSKPAAEVKIAVPPVKAKPVSKPKPKKPIKAIEGINLEEFEDIETLDSEEEIEEIEEIEDIDSLEEIEEIEDAGKEGDDETAIEEKAAADTVLIDGVEETEEGEDEEEDTKPKPKKGASKKAAPKAKPKKKGKR